MYELIAEYEKQAKERTDMGVNPQAMTAEQTQAAFELLLNENNADETRLLSLITYFTPAGVDDAAKVKSDYLTQIANGELACHAISPEKAVELLGTMQGGYNVMSLIDLLENSQLAELAAAALKMTIMVYDAFDTVKEKADAGNSYAAAVLQSWADAEWFLSRPAVAESIPLTVFKVTGETNTDDLSPAQDAWSRPDIPLHAQAMLKMSRDGIEPDEPGKKGPVQLIESLKAKGLPLAYVGDVVGTGSSRKSATNSVLWHMGQDIPFVPNKRFGGLCLAGKIAPIFFNTMEDSGALPIENIDVTAMNMGDEIEVRPYEGIIRNRQTGAVLSQFTLKTEVLLDEVRAGGRIPLIIGRKLTAKARQALNLPESEVFRAGATVEEKSGGFTLAQKIVGKACGTDGIRPGQYCEPKISTVGSQDTTGAMTRDEIKDLACLKYSAELVMQSFCHTSAYPRKIDSLLHATLPEFYESREGIALRPGDGVIHSWLNRMLVPDTVGTGGDSHTRFPVGISFPAGSGLVAFSAATGTMPLDMPESVLVRFKGDMNPGITLRDLVHAIPYFAIQQGLLTVEKQGKKNIFSGRILEIQGLKGLSVDQAFELADASAERSAAACTIALEQDAVIQHTESNVTLLRWMISQGYGHAETLQRRVDAMNMWLANPELLAADDDAAYAAVIEIDLAAIHEPILCCPNDPDDVRLLSEEANTPVDECFIGSCMTNIGHFRASAELLKACEGTTQSKLWIAPPTRMDEDQLKLEGVFNRFALTGARTEQPGCSLCMGNQARVAENCTAVSTSTRNFPNRLGQGAKVYLASAELATITAIKGALPTKDEYLQAMQVLSGGAADIYSYLQFDQMEAYEKPSYQVIHKQAV
ncbi:bifunctional aconitate hydratase 2/2-methylisocitrate dehydratase [Vibrio quintilis]|uniref:Aconitate hydratase B n=1 Tax=Vibrio quintilis TaxID=1117707 RepID=A0A1M7YQJ2_9VIBR|nr:bifunctional aconitate hydratase 2/2-methylisocitrate dehydratase [Vibrio quintilis]SHO54911.1 Aconitate hydratase 2 [Vibrio quintilis]